jgi:GntR family transcriptional regulator/MocR family aminotransferase
LKSLDTDGRVLYAGSFSKTLFPSLRLGYLVAPDALLADLVQTIQFRNAGAATLPQAITAQFMIEGHFTRHLKRMRNLYARRRSALAEALGAVFPDTFNIQLTGGGMNIIARLPTHIRDTVLVERAAVHGIALYALSTHALSDRGDNALIFGFTNVPEENAGPLAQQLKNILT